MRSNILAIQGVVAVVAVTVVTVMTVTPPIPHLMGLFAVISPSLKGDKDLHSARSRIHSPLAIRSPIMPHVVSILLASITTWFRSRLSMQMEFIALRHQVAIYKESVARLKLRSADRWLWV